jgi:hypothetical protein
MVYLHSVVFEVPTLTNLGKNTNCPKIFQTPMVQVELSPYSHVAKRNQTAHGKRLFTSIAVGSFAMQGNQKSSF